jgi:hypothetical protein
LPDHALASDTKAGPGQRDAEAWKLRSCRDVPVMTVFGGFPKPAAGPREEAPDNSV